MSRWIDQFQAHPFQATWDSVKAVLEVATVDDKTVITAVTELARLKKVTAYLDQMIHGIDPELVPASTWDSFNGQATPCLESIRSYNSDRNIAHIQQANAHADNLLTYVRPYVVTARKVGKALQEAIRSYAKTIDEYGESFRTRSDAIVSEINLHAAKSAELLASIKNTESKISEYQQTLFGSQESGGIKDKVSELFDDIKDKNQAINAYHNEIFVGDPATPSRKVEIESVKGDILKDRDKINKLLEEISPDVKALENFYVKIFGKANDDDEQLDGLAGELDLRIKALEEFEDKQKKKYSALNKQIEGLLPGATSAGLASAYLDMKKSFDLPIKNMSAMFYVAIGLLVLASVMLTINNISISDVGVFHMDFVNIKDWDAVLKSVVNKIPFYAPILWLGFYASKRRSEYQRLQQEYAHKEALAKSYDSYKQQLEQLDAKDLEMQKNFILKAIDAISYNASVTLDGKHGDKMPALELIEKTASEISKAIKLIKPEST